MKKSNNSTKIHPQKIHNQRTQSVGNNSTDYCWERDAFQVFRRSNEEKCEFQISELDLQQKVHQTNLRFCARYTEHWISKSCQEQLFWEISHWVLLTLVQFSINIYLQKGDNDKYATRGLYFSTVDGRSSTVLGSLDSGQSQPKPKPEHLS